MTEDKSKYELTIDFVMILGKYFEENKDFINVMKVCKKYKELVEMYHFNPISDISLFKQIETQHFYKKEDVINKKDKLFQYIYWFGVNYDKIISSKKNNEIYKDVIFNKECLKSEDIKNNNFIVPEGITRIGNKCFNNYSILTNIQLPSNLKELGSNSFEKTNITTITIPESVTKFGYGCFNKCTQLTNVQLPPNLKELSLALLSQTNIKSIIIPEGVTKINEMSFLLCTQLSYVQLPSTLKEIQGNVFSKTKITTIRIPEGVTRIGHWCFCDCLQLKNIILPSSLIEIGHNALSNTSITFIKIPQNVNKIGESCFNFCNKLNLIELYNPDLLILDKFIAEHFKLYKDEVNYKFYKLKK